MASADTGPVRRHADGATVAVKVVPRARRTELAGTHGDELRIRVAAPPVDGAANLQVVELIARLCGISPSRVSLVRGRASQHKVVLVTGADPDRVRAAVGQ